MRRARTGMFAVLAVALVAFCAAVAAARETSSEADRLRSIEQTRLRALVDADTGTARKLIAPDFKLINPGGDVLSRDQYLDAVEAGAIDYLVFAPTSPIEVRLSGNSAALRHQVSFDLAVGGGIRLTHEGWITALSERRQGRWQIAWEQATAIPNDFDRFVESIKPRG